MKPVCDHCKREFELNSEQSARVDNAKAKDRHAIFVKCPCCDLSTLVQWAEPKHREPLLRCPVSACSGHVVRVQNDGLETWNCGECGAQWKQQAALQQEITNIVKQFTYRKKCYRKVDKQWVSAGPASEVPDYEERVANEPDDPLDTYQRG